MLPFPRAKLQGENLEQFATQAAVARAKREAMDYTDDMFARTAKGVQEDGRKPATIPSPSYFFRAQQEIADLRTENARLGGEVFDQAKTIAALTKECDHLRLATDLQGRAVDDLQKRCAFMQDRSYQSVKTIEEMQAAAKQRDAFVQVLEETNLALQRQCDNVIEGREKAVAFGIELAKENDRLTAKLGRIRLRAEAVPVWQREWTGFASLLEACQ